MYAIEHFCGRKYGGWQRGEVRFTHLGGAQEELRSLVRAESRCDATPFMRRIVEVNQ